MKTLILLALAALPAFAETAVTWNVVDVEKLRAMGVPGITPVTYDGVFVYAEQKEGVVSGFVVQVTFADGGVVAHYAPAVTAGCTSAEALSCAAVSVPFPRGAAIQQPKLVKVFPVYVAMAADAVEVKP